MRLPESLTAALLSTFCPARPAHWSYTYGKTLLHTILFWTLFLLLLPLALVALERTAGIPAFAFPTQGWSPWAAFAAFGGLGLLSSAFMVAYGEGTPLPVDCARRLVVVGPYRYVRNPMAIAGLGQAAAVGMLLGSPATVAYSVAGLVVWDQVVRPIEEEDLRRRFAAQFEHYRAHVACWRPRLTPYQPPGEA